MFTITQEQMIWLTRGDSAMFDVALLCGTVLDPLYYSLEEGDKVYFGLMEPNQKFEDAIMKKVFTVEDCPQGKNGYITIKLNPNDTEFLKKGLYYYEIKAQLIDGTVNTIIPKRKFFIVE